MGAIQDPEWELASGLMHAAAASLPSAMLTDDLEDGRERKGEVFRFGQYKGHTLRSVTENHPDYFFWACQQKKPGLFLQRYITWVHERYHVDLEENELEARQ
eukprot:6458236-Amphidinium_carterae.1